MFDTLLTSVLCTAAVGTAPEISSAGLDGVSRLLVDAYLAHPRLYALGVVVGLVVLGTAVGLATEAVLRAMGRGTERITHHHE
jgi:hypothetical protein